MDWKPKYHVEINKCEAHGPQNMIIPIKPIYYYSFDSTTDVFKDEEFYLFGISEYGSFRIAMNQVLSMKIVPIESNNS